MMNTSCVCVRNLGCCPRIGYNIEFQAHKMVQCSTSKNCGVRYQRLKCEVSIKECNDYNKTGCEVIMYVMYCN